MGILKPRGSGEAPRTVKSSAGSVADKAGLGIEQIQMIDCSNYKKLMFGSDSARASGRPANEYPVKFALRRIVRQHWWVVRHPGFGY